MYVINFDLDFAKMPPKEFVQKYILRMQAIHVVAGFDFTYGYRGQGKMNMIGQDGRGRFGVTVVPKISLLDKKISSTYIRELLLAGEVSKIPDLLNDYHETLGEITSHRTKNSGIYTIEITSYEKFMLPACGSYDVVWKVDDTEYHGISLLTTKQSGNQNIWKLIQTHANKNLLGKCVKIRWIKTTETFIQYQ